ncbi:MAG TPA: hypothetical protein VEK57_26850 [Thermoanaerobaculia bacterium]|nr:hypothetical protein [Thermoanaerobaculia bacterium]
MSDEATCGKGLAANSILPARLAAVTAAMAEVLDGHRTSLDLDAVAGRAEDAAYVTLTDGFRDVSAALTALADRMAGYRDLPMAIHDEAALMTPAATATFATYVQSERDLLHWLQDSVRQHTEMLSAIG